MPGNPLQSGARYTTLAQDDEDSDSQNWCPPPQVQQQTAPSEFGADPASTAGYIDSTTGRPGSLYEELRAQALVQEQQEAAQREQMARDDEAHARQLQAQMAQLQVGGNAASGAAGTAGYPPMPAPYPGGTPGAHAMPGTSSQARFIVTVPANVVPGQQLIVQSPDGARMVVRVPPGCMPGAQFQVAYDRAAVGAVVPNAHMTAQAGGGVGVQQPTHSADPQIVESLVSMGFAHEQAERAAIHATSVEACTEWLLAHGDDDADAGRNASGADPGPAPAPAPEQRQQQRVVANSEIATSLQAMGFSYAAAIEALRVTNNNPDAAVEWLTGPDGERYTSAASTGTGADKTESDLLDLTAPAASAAPLAPAAPPVPPIPAVSQHSDLAQGPPPAPFEAFGQFPLESTLATLPSGQHTEQPAAVKREDIGAALGAIGSLGDTPAPLPAATAGTAHTVSTNPFDLDLEATSADNGPARGMSGPQAEQSADQRQIPAQHLAGNTAAASSMPASAGGVPAQMRSPFDLGPTPAPAQAALTTSALQPSAAPSGRVEEI
eukprot:g3050.t1